MSFGAGHLLNSTLHGLRPVRDQSAEERRYFPVRALQGCFLGSLRVFFKGPLRFCLETLFPRGTGKCQIQIVGGLWAICSR